MSQIYIQYLPFGRLPVRHRNSEFDSRYKFTAKELDEETGLYYYGARYYDPKIGIWLSVDPKANWYYSMSPYNYAANNSTRFIDPDGMEMTDFKDKEGNLITHVQDSSNALEEMIKHQNG